LGGRSELNHPSRSHSVPLENPERDSKNGGSEGLFLQPIVEKEDVLTPGERARELRRGGEMGWDPGRLDVWLS
jgi:hypothetical protein